MPHWLAAWRRRWLLYHLADAQYAFMLDPAPQGEWVALDCETTGLDVRKDRIVSIGAVRIAGNRLLTSQRLELLVRPGRTLKADNVRVHRLRERDVARGLAPAQAMHRLLNFIGSRPLVGYHLAFDVAMINREIWPLLGIGLPQRRIEVSAMYYDFKNRQRPLLERDGPIDLRFARMLNELALPMRESHDALNDAVMAGLAFLKLRCLLQEPVLNLPAPSRSALARG
jgi:DNA polymerase-3 subunit epsilon